jgi:hypothetical protein
MQTRATLIGALGIFLGLVVGLKLHDYAWHPYQVDVESEANDRPQMTAHNLLRAEAQARRMASSTGKPIVIRDPSNLTFPGEMPVTVELVNPSAAAVQRREQREAMARAEQERQKAAASAEQARQEQESQRQAEIADWQGIDHLLREARRCGPRSKVRRKAILLRAETYAARGPASGDWFQVWCQIQSAESLSDVENEEKGLANDIDCALNIVAAHLS